MNSGTQKLLSFSEVIEERNFIIPDYQRGYSWDEQQVDDLIKDIENICNKEHKHYTGTIVATLKEGSSNVFEIVDGQQRLTTLVVLMLVISEEHTAKYGYLKSDVCVKGIIGKEEYLLQTNLETWDCFRSIVYENSSFPPTIKSHHAIIEAKRLLKNWLLDKNKKIDIDVVVDAIMNNIGFLFFVPEYTKEIGIMFEVINNRGKALSELEKIKNYFIYYSTIHTRESLRNKINSKWGHIQIWLSNANITSNDDENSFLRNCFIVYFDTNKTKSWYVYDELKKLYNPHITDDSIVNENIKDIDKFVDFLSEASLHYAYLNSSKGYFDLAYTDTVGEKKELSAVLKQLRCHPVKASILPLYLAGMSYIKTHTKLVVAFLKLLEIVNFRIYVLPNTKIARADSKQGDLFNWAHEFYIDRNWNSVNDPQTYKTWLDRKIEGNIIDYITMQLEDFTLTLCPDETFIQSLTTESDEAIDYYHWAGLRFFLASYEEERNKERKETWDIDKIMITREESNSDQSRNDYLSKEHIWASKNREVDFPVDYRDKRRLGNFVLLGLSSNIQLQNDDIENKVKFLIDKSSISTRQVADLSNYLKNAIEKVKTRRANRTKYFFSDIAMSLIDQRENDLIKFALKRWKLIGEKRSKFDRVDSFEAKDIGKKEYYFLKD